MSIRLKIPIRIAKQLTISVLINPGNIDFYNNPDNQQTIVRVFRKGTHEPEYSDQHKLFKCGDQIERSVQSGDKVVINGNFGYHNQAHQIEVDDQVQDVLIYNIGRFNADFDGDFDGDLPQA